MPLGLKTPVVAGMLVVSPVPLAHTAQLELAAAKFTFAIPPDTALNNVGGVVPLA